MNKILIFGVVLIILGGIGLAIEGFTWTDREQIVDIGPIEASADVQREQTIPPILAGGVLLLGLGITVYGATRKG